MWARNGRNSMSYRKASTVRDEISLWLTCDTYHNPAEKKKKKQSIDSTAAISINYTKTNNFMFDFPCIISSYI